MMFQFIIIFLGKYSEPYSFLIHYVNKYLPVKSQFVILVLHFKLYSFDYVATNRNSISAVIFLSDCKNNLLFYIQLHSGKVPFVIGSIIHISSYFCIIQVDLFKQLFQIPWYSRNVYDCDCYIILIYNLLIMFFLFNCYRYV